MSAFLIIIYVLCGIYMIINFKHDIHILQQNSYRLDRYWRWLRRSGDMSSASRLVDVALLFLLFAVNLLDIRMVVLIVALVCVIKTWIITKQKHIKPLVFTRRVWRIYSVTSIIALAIYVPVMVACGNRDDIFNYYSCASISLGTLFILTIFSWVVVMLAVTILKPVEASINRKYWNEASSMLRSMPDLTIIGVTGSYGKTSTKHYLYRILSEQFDVLMTPGSFNTPMGVIRTVREMMKPYHQIFICEMGAKQLGDIKEICDLVHPEMGIITAVGEMHLESFKTIENVQRTKFELVDSLPSNGLAVVNNDFEYCANREVSNVECVRYAVKNDICDYRAEDIVVSADGTEFTVAGPDGYKLRLHTRLVGECNISNLLAAVIIARKFGVSDEKIKYAVADIQQVEHRLSVKKTATGVTIIDDAFNSNPSGSKMAVDVLSNITQGKRIIVTPGMIELGAEQFNLNKEFGRYVGEHVDIAIVVGSYNRDAIVEGIKETEFNEKNLYIAASFAEAQKILGQLMTSGDAVLYENDLPDTFK